MTRWLSNPLLFITTAAVLCMACQRNSPHPLSKVATLEVYDVVLPLSGMECRAIYDPDSKSQIYLKLPPIVTSADVATVQRNDSQPQPALTVRLTPQGAQKLAAATTPATGQKLAIVVNGQVAGVPTVRSPLSTSFAISGGAFHKEREDIFESLTKD